MAELTEITSGLRFPEGPIAMADGSVVLVEIVRPPAHPRRSRRHRRRPWPRSRGGPNGAAVGPDGALYLCNNGGCFDAGRPRRDAAPRRRRPDRYVGGRIQRVDLATGDGHRPVHRVRRAPAAGAERPRLRRARRLLVHRPRHPRTTATSDRDRHLLRARRRLVDHARSCSRSTRPTASACRPTATPSTGPRPTPAACSRRRIDRAGRGSRRRRVRPDGRACCRPARATSCSTRWPSTATATSASARSSTAAITVISPDGARSSTTCRRATS